MATSSRTASRASADVRHLQRGAGGGGRGAHGASRGDVERLMKEAARHLTDEKEQARQARRNANIRPEDTKRNQAWVRDEHGQMKVAESVEEIMAARDRRQDRVFRKQNEKAFTDTTVLMHVPLSLCERVEWPVKTKSGKTITRHRYEVKDRVEYERWLVVARRALGSQLAGGDAAITAMITNEDEYRPHVHFLTDPYENDPKHPGKLKTAAARMWGREKGESPYTARNVKMPRFHQNIRQAMLDAGFEVEREVDPLRHKRRSHLEDYQEVQRLLDEIEERAAELDQQSEDAKALKAAAEALREKVEADREQAVKEGREDGYQEGYQDGHGEGFAAGEAAGLEAGVEAGHAEGHAVGYAAGKEAGHAEGLTAGRREGKAEWEQATAEVKAGAEQAAKDSAEKVRTDAAAAALDRARKMKQLDDDLSAVESAAAVLDVKQQDEAPMSAYTAWGKGAQSVGVTVRKEYGQEVAARVVQPTLDMRKQPKLRNQLLSPSQRAELARKRVEPVQRRQQQRRGAEGPDSPSFS